MFPPIENVLAIPIPFIGYPDLITANVYALGNGPVTLIDTGPRVKGAFEFLQETLKHAGFSLRDIDTIIVTHGHVDHFGLAARIRETVGHPVKCFLHPEEKWRTSNENFESKLWNQEIERMLVVADTPMEIIRKIKRRFYTVMQLAEPLDEVDFIVDREEIHGEGFHLEVIHTPGHTAGSVCLYERENKILFSGDHVIKHITPNPIVEVRREHLKAPGYKSLDSYLRSLDKLNLLETNFVFPGHGEYLTDLHSVISKYVIHHRQRMDTIWRTIKEKPHRIYQLVNEVFPFVPEDHIFLAISEVVSHLEMLVDQGKAKLVDLGPPVVYHGI